MPKATVSHETFRKELRTCPGGFVVLRTLSYYEMMRRRDIASKLYTEQKVGKRNRQDTEFLKAQLEVMNVAIMEFEFANCIVDHNLEDENDVKLDFTNPMTFKSLDPKIGQEIADYIDELNQEPEEGDLAPLPNAATSSSQDGETRQLEIIPET